MRCDQARAGQLSVWSGRIGLSEPSGLAGLFVHIEKSHDGDIVQLLASLEEGDLNDKKESDQAASQLLDQVACSRGRTTYFEAGLLDITHATQPEPRCRTGD